MADVEGWERCRSFAKEVISEVERNGNRPPHGPYLISVELSAIPSLREDICDYGNRSGPTSSCCFVDLRSHLRTLEELDSWRHTSNTVGGCTSSAEVSRRCQELDSPRHEQLGSGVSLTSGRNY